MSCESESQQARSEHSDLPDWFDNLGATYANSAIPGVRQLGKLMQVISAIDVLENGPNYSLSNIGKAWGGLVGSVAGGAIGAIGAGLLLAPFALGAGVVATAAAVGATMVAAYYGSRALEDLFEEYGEQMGQEWEDALRDHQNDLDDATNGSDPSSDCPDNEGQSGMGGPFHNGPNTPLVLDMDGDGVELISLESSSTLFDIDNDNFAEHIRRTGDSALHRLPAQAGVSPAQGAGLHP